MKLCMKSHLWQPTISNFPWGGGGEGHALRPPWVGLPLQALLYAVYYASLATYENFNIPENPE